MQIQPPCPESGREYLRITREEVYAMVDIVSQALQRHPIGERKYPQIEAVPFLGFCNILVDDDDITMQELGLLVDYAEKAGIGVPPAILSPGRTFERYRGTWGNDQYHWLRRFKHSRWMQERFKKNGIDIAHEYGVVGFVMPIAFLGDVPTIDKPVGPLPPVPENASRYEAMKHRRGPTPGLQPQIAWFEVRMHPQIEAMRVALEKCRTTENNKRKLSRNRVRAKKLRAAGYAYQGFRGLVKIEKEPG